MKMKKETAVQIESYGGPGVLKTVKFDLSPPKKGEVRIRQKAIGVNFVDIYHREGLYGFPSPPAILGVEASGVVEEIGEAVTNLSIGQRVVYAGQGVGSYCTARNISSEKLVSLPEEVGFTEAASMFLRGLTAYMLLHHVYFVQEKKTLLVHAAAGGMGQVLGQWAKKMGATLIGTVGSQEKGMIAETKGYDHIIHYREKDFVKEVRKVTNNLGVDYAIDGVGGETLLKTLEAVKAFGMVSSIGQAERHMKPLSLFDLGPVRSLTLSRPSVSVFVSNLKWYRKGAMETLNQMKAGMQVDVSQILPLEEAENAHLLLEKREALGSIILTCEDK